MPGNSKAPATREEMVQMIDEWAKLWQTWGDEAHAKLFKGDPDEPVDPPPTPPFGGP